MKTGLGNRLATTFKCNSSLEQQTETQKNTISLFKLEDKSNITQKITTHSSNIGAVGHFFKVALKAITILPMLLQCGKTLSSPSQKLIRTSDIKRNTGECAKMIVDAIDRISNPEKLKHLKFDNNGEYIHYNGTRVVLVIKEHPVEGGQKSYTLHTVTKNMVAIFCQKKETANHVNQIYDSNGDADTKTLCKKNARTINQFFNNYCRKEYRKILTLTHSLNPSKIDHTTTGLMFDLDDTLCLLISYEGEQYSHDKIPTAIAAGFTQNFSYQPDRQRAEFLVHPQRMQEIKEFQNKGGKIGVSTAGIYPPNMIKEMFAAHGIAMEEKDVYNRNHETAPTIIEYPRTNKWPSVTDFQKKHGLKNVILYDDINHLAPESEDKDMHYDLIHAEVGTEWKDAKLYSNNRERGDSYLGIFAQSA